MRLLILFLTFLFTVTGPVYAQPVEIDQSAFKEIPILHEGRIKPIDSFARLYLKSFSGRENLADMSAADWLAETLFDPANAVHRPVFKVRQPELLDLPDAKNHLYSYAELAESLKNKANTIITLIAAPEESWTADQRTLVTYHEYSILYTQMLRSFSMVLPLAVQPPENLRKEWDIPVQEYYNLLDFKKYEQRLKNEVEAVLARRGNDPEKLTQSEQEISRFAYQVQMLETASANNVLFRIMPGAWQSGGKEWLSPWAVYRMGQGSPQNAAYLDIWQEMIAAYQQVDAEGWKTATDKALAHIYQATAADDLRPRIKLELLYNGLHLLTAAMILYLLSFISMSAYTMRSNRNLYRASLAILLAGMTAHICAIAFRIFILERPPVGTLYESILFVSLISVIGAALFEKNQKNGGGILVGSIAGGLLLAIATAFAADNTMKMLVAVLNTNFWLATHVLCISIGYGWCVIGGVMAHFYLFRRYRFGRSEGDLKQMNTNIKTVAILALLFTAVGTALGGIWADQSWGRFWGWDPKENGALLIVLWLVWLLHSRITGHLRPLHFIIGMAALNIIVALAWFGVNLLSVGLHSYGFTAGISAGLTIFCTAELSIIGALWYLTEKKEVTR